MKPLIFHFYSLQDCIGADGKTLDYKKMDGILPVDSIRAKPKALLRMHLEHLGFEISMAFPQLEGKVLHAELVFAGEDGAPKIPTLVAMHEQKVVAAKPVLLQSLDMSEFLSLLITRNAELDGSCLVYRMTCEEDENSGREYES